MSYSGSDMGYDRSALSSEERRVVAEKLDATADYLETEGWLRKSFGYTKHYDKSPACALGALRVVCNVANPDDFGSTRIDADPADFTIARKAMSQMSRCLQVEQEMPWPVSVVGWNDRPGQTAENVIAEFRACAERLRNNEEAAS